MSKGEVGVLLMMAAAAFPSVQERELGMTTRLWELLLSDLDFEVAEKALFKVLSTSKFFPTPAEIRAESKNFISRASDEPPSAYEAWDEVFASVRDGHILKEWSHEFIKMAVRMIGFRTMLMSDRISVERAQFFKIYEDLLNQKVNADLKEKIEELVQKRDMELLAKSEAKKINQGA